LLSVFQLPISVRVTPLWGVEENTAILAAHIKDNALLFFTHKFCSFTEGRNIIVFPARDLQQLSQAVEQDLSLNLPLPQLPQIKIPSELEIVDAVRLAHY
jgi:hypothetical protein